MKQREVYKGILKILGIILLIFFILWMLNIFPIKTLAPTESEEGLFLVPEEERKEFLYGEFLRDQEGFLRQKPLLLSFGKNEGSLADQEGHLDHLRLLLEEEVFIEEILMEDVEWPWDEELKTFLVDSKGRVAKTYSGLTKEGPLLEGVRGLLEEEQ